MKNVTKPKKLLHEVINSALRSTFSTPQLAMAKRAVNTANKFISIKQNTEKFSDSEKTTITPCSSTTKQKSCVYNA
jgi:hypothetical protein